MVRVAPPPPYCPPPPLLLLSTYPRRKLSYCDGNTNPYLYLSLLFYSTHYSYYLPLYITTISLLSISLHLYHPLPYLIMATHVITPTTTTITNQQISLYGHPSPASSNNTTPTTTTNSSPTSPRLSSATLNQLPLQSRQLRPPKAPLYVPAALRPTERPQRHSPPTPPRSVHGSLDSLSNSDSEVHEPISRRSTMDSTTSSNGIISKLAEDEWMKNEDLGSVTGLPTRDHWKVSISPRGNTIYLYV